MTSPLSETPKDLQKLQGWLQTAIATPWLTNPAELELVVKNSEGQLNQAERLNIYTRSYQGRLVQCMESEYPSLRLALGEELFNDFAKGYLMQYPSQSYTLTNLGKKFPQYLQETRPDEEAGSWPDFMIELATLERLFSEVYHGEGMEHLGDSEATKTEEILLEKGTHWMHCHFPIDEFFISARKHLKDEKHSEAPEFPAPEPISLLIFRRQYVVQLRRVEAHQLPSQR